MVKFFLGVVLLLITIVNTARAESENMKEIYHQEAIADAIKLNNDFDNLEKPKYQRVYSDHLLDMQIISFKGQAPDNEWLYDDLRKMKSNDKVIYNQNRQQLNKRVYPIY